MRVFGIDPGSTVTGWGVVQVQGSRMHFIDAGFVRTSPRRPIPERLMKIHDELQHAGILVTDGLRLTPSETKPTRPEHEQDRDFLRSLWRKVLAGDTPMACETELAVDSYRVRCAIAHWLDEGALQPAV